MRNVILKTGEKMKYDIVVVGCGFTGSVIARKLAEEENKKILIYEKREHIAGNMYDEYNSDGILIQKYGPHVFHTDNESVYQYISRFCEWKPFKVISKVNIDGKVLPSPFNYKAIDYFYSKKEGKELKESLETYFQGQEVITVIDLLESNNLEIKKYGELLFEKDYRPYTSKQWGISPEEIDISVLKRCPVFLSYREEYLNDKYEALPKGGFTKLFERMLSHPNITLITGRDILEDIKLDDKNNCVTLNGAIFDNPIIYTGAIDELLEYKYGQLPYRSLKFEWKNLNIDSYQTSSIVAYPQAEKFTRITEYTKMPIQKIEGKTTIAIEYPIPFKKETMQKIEPYYPIINEKNNSLYQLYLNLLSFFPNILACGRLGDYKYYNMDQAIERAFEVVSILKKGWSGC